MKTLFRWVVLVEVARIRGHLCWVAGMNQKGSWDAIRRCQAVLIRDAGNRSHLIEDVRDRAVLGKVTGDQARLNIVVVALIAKIGRDAQS